MGSYLVGIGVTSLMLQGPHSLTAQSYITPLEFWAQGLMCGLHGDMCHSVAIHGPRNTHTREIALSAVTALVLRVLANNQQVCISTVTLLAWVHGQRKDLPCAAPTHQAAWRP